MDTNSKAIENLQTIRQILEQSKMNPGFKELDIIYKKTFIKEENEGLIASRREHPLFCPALARPEHPLARNISFGINIRLSNRPKLNAGKPF